MICGAVFDVNEESRTYIRKWLIDYLINELQHDRFIRIDSIKMEEIAVLKHETSFGMKN